MKKKKYNNTKINISLSEKFVFYKTWKFYSACFHICSSQRFVPLVSFHAYTQTFEMEGAGV